MSDLALRVMLLILILAVLILVFLYLKLRTAFGRYGKLFDLIQHSNDGVMLIDEKGIIREWNPALYQITGISESEALGRFIWDIQSQIFSRDSEKNTQGAALRAKILAYLQKGDLLDPNNPIEYSIRTRDNKIKILQELEFPIKTKVGYSLGSVIRDVTDFTKVEEALSEIALVDELTGLYNRRGFKLLADQKLIRIMGQGQIPILVFVDLDKMKNINDRFGHDNGDLALQTTANILRESFRDEDIIGRWGGDEFVAMVSIKKEKDTEIIKTRIQQYQEFHNENDGYAFNLSLSVGFAIANLKKTHDLEVLIEEADGQMYREKVGKS